MRRYVLVGNILLLGLVMFLSHRVYTIWNAPDDGEVSPGSAHHVPAEGTFASLQQGKRVARSGYHAVSAKDLFRPERTEWHAPAEEVKEDAPATVAAMPANVYRIYGIVIADGTRQAWVLEEGQRDKPRKVSEGESLDGWQITSIDADSVTLGRGKEIVTYRMIEPGNPKARSGARMVAQRSPSSSPAAEPSGSRYDRSARVSRRHAPAPAR